MYFFLLYSPDTFNILKKYIFCIKKKIYDMGLTPQHTVCFILLFLDTAQWEGEKETLAVLL